MAIRNLLSRTAARTLREIATHPRHLGAEIGFLAVLHTRGQNLSYHSQPYCVVPGGGLGPEGDRWVSCRPGIFLPVRVLSRRFRTLFLQHLECAFRQGSLRLEGSPIPPDEPVAFDRYLVPVRKTEWVVYSKPPFDGPARALDYVGRDIPCIAVSKDRLLPSRTAPSTSAGRIIVTRTAARPCAWRPRTSCAAS